MKTAVLSLTVFVVLVPVTGNGQCVSQLYPYNSAGIISVMSANPYVTTTDIGNAVSMWNACPQAGVGFPGIAANQFGGDITFSVDLVSGQSTYGCGEFHGTYNSTGQVTGGTLVLWDATANGHDCEPIRVETIAHELGHGLGLGDSNCPGYIMGPPITGGCRSVQPDECQEASQLWQTPSEPPPPSGTPQTCNNATDGDCESPILINFGGGAWELSGRNDPVLFDLDASGSPEPVTWTARNAPIAFLALDRNGNGRIDDGGELFGNHTRFPSGAVAPNGFAALAAYDANGDGVIDAADPIWPYLLLWIDANHDGISQPEELTRLADSGITALSYAVHWTGRTDSAGNTFRYESICYRGRLARTYYDVFFVRLR